MSDTIIDVMAELPLNPPVIIFVVGIPGSGKTHFARQLAVQYNLPYISENRIRYELFEQSQFSSDEAIIVSNLANMTYDNLLITKTPFIYETSANRAERSRLIKLATQKGYRTLTVWVQADIQSALNRSLKKDKRRPDDKYSHAMSAEVFKEQAKRFTAPSGREEYVVVSGKYAYKNQYLAVVRKLMQMYGGSTLDNVAKTRMTSQASSPAQPSRPHRQNI